MTISTMAQVPNTLTPSDKVYGLSKFWQEVNYNFIYLEKINRIKWDSTYRAMITTVQQTKNDYEYYRELQKFCALLKDGHTDISFPQYIDTLIYRTSFGEYRFGITLIDNKAIISFINKSKKDELQVGSEIIEVNGLPTQEYINKFVTPYISSSTDYVLHDWSVIQMLEGLKGEKYEIRIKTPDGKIKAFSLTHGKTMEKELYPPEEDKQLMNFKWYDNNIAYIALNSFADPKIDTLFIQKLIELYKAKGLIIDLRSNHGGNTGIGVEIFKYLTNDTLLYGSRTRSRQHIPTYKAWGKFIEPKDTINNEEAKKLYLSFHDKYYYKFNYEPDTVKLKAKRIIVPTVILIGHSTGSAAEDFLIYAANQKHMIKIGENSNGSTGQPFIFELPGGGSARVCTKQDTYPDGKEFVGYGVKPDIEIKPTLNDYLNKKDAVIDKALEYLKTKIK
jgi:C-terminal processing protease CtpA/Prc